MHKIPWNSADKQPSASHDNEIGIPYILMSKAAGRPLAGAMGFNKEGRIKVSTQLGVIARKLYNNAFEKIESLHLVDGGIYDIGECLAPSLIWQWRDELEDIARGPYANDNQYFEALISAFISHAKELYMSPHAFAPIPDPDDYADSNASRAASDRWNAFLTIGCKVEHSKNRLAYCVAGELMREMLPLMCGGSGAEGGFPLIHPDLHHSNVFVDDNFNITCLIDWSSAHTTPVTEMPLASRLKSNPPSDTEFDHFEEGFGSEGDLELPDEWRGKARVLWPFERLIRMLARQELALFEMLFDLAWPSSSIPMPELFFQRSKMEDNRKLLAELAADDMTPEDVEKEEAYVGMRDNKAEIEQIAVARKLTVMAEMNPLFVADRTLWRWLGETLDDDKQSCE